MLPRVGDQGDEPLEEGERGVEGEGSRAVAADGELALREGGASDIAPGAFEPKAFLGLEVDGRVEGVPAELPLNSSGGTTFVSVARRLTAGSLASKSCTHARNPIC